MDTRTLFSVCIIKQIRKFVWNPTNKSNNFKFMILSPFRVHCVSIINITVTSVVVVLLERNTNICWYVRRCCCCCSWWGECDGPKSSYSTATGRKEPMSHKRMRRRCGRRQFSPGHDDDIFNVLWILTGNYWKVINKSSPPVHNNNNINKSGEGGWKYNTASDRIDTKSPLLNLNTRALWRLLLSPPPTHPPCD